MPAPVPRYFRFDPSGLFFVDASGEHQLVSDAIGSASHDGMGGVLYTGVDDAWQHGLHWTRPGPAEPTTLNYLHGFGAVLDRRPTLVAPSGAWPEDCPETEYQVDLLDLKTGEERPLGCFGGEDGGISVVTGGGGLLVATSWLAVGAGGTDLRIHFFDTTGREVQHPANPVTESCAPCELDVRLSPDGSLLAYRLRPDAKWSEDLEKRHRLDRLSTEEWWETSKDVLATIAIVDLANGEQPFSTVVPAGERLVDFDGRHLVIESCELVDRNGPTIERTCRSRVLDSEGLSPDVFVHGSVRLATEVCCAPPIADVFPPLLRVWSPGEGQVVDSPTYRFEGIADPRAEVVAAGLYPVAVDPNGTWSTVLILQPGENLATITATDVAGNTTTVRRTVTYQPNPAPDDRSA